MKRSISIFLLLIFVSILLAGCGETISGMAKDVKRIGKGTKTVFIRED